MRRSRLAVLRAVLLAGTFALPLSAAADAPRVIADIAPVHSLVARVMQGAGTPDLLLEPGVSPHGVSLRPSQARALSEAEFVFSVGMGLAPAVEEAAEALAPGAVKLELMEAPGTLHLDMREEALFGGAAGGHSHGDDHGHGEAAHGDHGHADHGDEEHGHDDHAHEQAGQEDHAHDDHGHEDAGHEDHSHDHGHDHAGGVDPHGWLSPANAAVWAAAISEELSAADPENAALYAANAEAAVAEIEAARAEAEALLAPVRGRAYVVFHDAYGYFEEAFDIPALGAVAASDASDPSARRALELRDGLAEAGLVCAFIEPQFDGSIVPAILGDEVRVAIVDPLGSEIAPGPDFYPELLRSMARAMSDCLSGA
ncbi:zinc ABC transporter substrate-binding protein [Histidinibacterium lentulum]|uniref:High-affinity zinc uptake system protein ZnuA n=1 Tax=Histidinibacterium lentulum TaxID=2480588 RepID=A0A3N2R744_9RHOB|nr:zinc ABC transporter substrate-binding protein [Histidinibacterium lentulum]ROU03299.1 zinc transporter [Histidinibacterium lentulum]